MNNTRRDFIRIVPAAGAGLLIGQAAFAQAMVDEKKDPQAESLDYVADNSKVNKTKYPKFTADQICGNCQLYKAKAGAAAGPCALFPGKLVAVKGWCKQYVKKP